MKTWYFALLVIGFILPTLRSTEVFSNTRKPAALCDVKNQKYGAKGDGVTDDTSAIQSAIDDCAGGSGGTVLLQSGTFLSGTISLKSNITFEIAQGATLKGTLNDNLYPDVHPQNISNTQLTVNCHKALLYAGNVKNITIDGGGTIDGSGSNPKWKGKEPTRPMAIFIVASQIVSIHDIHVENAGMWSVVNMETDQLTIQNITVHSPDGPTRDGIDIVDCHHALIENVEVFSEDDAICLKSGSARGVYAVTVRNSRVLQSSVANGLKLGTAAVGSFRKILFENIQVENVKQAVMAVESVDGGVIDGVTYRGIQFNNSGVGAYVLLGRRGKSPKTGAIKNILFQNITGTTNLSWGSAISGSSDNKGPHDVQNVTFDHVQITNGAAVTQIPPKPPEYTGQYPDPRLWKTLPAYGYFLRLVSGINFIDSSTKEAPSDSRPEIVQDRVSGFSKKP